MSTSELVANANALVASGKGILAADESTGTIKKRFDSIAVESTEDSRRDYRELLFTTAGVGDFISGVILYDETIRQKAKDGTPLVEILQSQGILPGIKVDAGAKPLAGKPGETVTEEQAEKVWLPYSQLPESAFYLYVPVGYGGAAKRIAKKFNVDVYGFRTWRYVPQGIEINDISEPPGIIHALMPPFARRMMRGQ